MNSRQSLKHNNQRKKTNRKSQPQQKKKPSNQHVNKPSKKILKKHQFQVDPTLELANPRNKNLKINRMNKH